MKQLIFWMLKQMILMYLALGGAMLFLLMVLNRSDFKIVAYTLWTPLIAFLVMLPINLYVYIKENKR